MLFDYSSARPAVANPRSIRKQWPNLIKSADAVYLCVQCYLAEHEGAFLPLPAVIEVAHVSKWLRQIWLDALRGGPRKDEGEAS